MNIADKFRRFEFGLSQPDWLKKCNAGKLDELETEDLQKAVKEKREYLKFLRFIKSFGEVKINTDMNNIESIDTRDMAELLVS